MKYKLLVFIIGIFGLVIFMQTERKGNNKVAKQALLNQQGQPGSVLLGLLSLTNIQHDGSLASIVEQTQKPESGWMRKEGTEIWDIVDASVENKEQFFVLFDQLNLIDAINPRQKHYDYLVVMGGAYPRVKNRLQYAMNLFKQGIRFDKIVLLGGARQLTDAEIAALIVDYKLQENDLIPTTESEVMAFMYENADMPADMRTVSMVLIDAHMKITKTGALVRPTAGDTVGLWLKANPKPGSCLVISNQPYIKYQDSVTKTLLPQAFTVETVGEKSEDTKIGIYLDTIARTLYQEKKRFNL